MAKVVTLGEIMLRLPPHGYQRFAQASDFEINYGGMEGQMWLLPAQFGNDAAFGAEGFLPMPLETLLTQPSRVSADCSHIVRGGNRLNLFLKTVSPSARQALSMTERIPRSQKQLLMNLISMRSWKR